MSEAVARNHNFTVRLSAEERAELETLAAQWEMDKSATVRRALQRALNERQRLPQSGHFVAVQTENTSFPVRLSGKVADDS
jgi:hypothetical protein